MSEEITEEVVEEQAPAPVAEAPQDNPLFKTLFEIGEGEEQEIEAEEPKEVARPPMTLSEAVEEEDQPQEQAEAPEEKTEEPKAETEAEPEKAEPKKKRMRKVVDPDIPEDVKKQPAFNLREEDPEEEEDQEFLGSLMPEERDIYDIAKYASKNIGDKYKGMDGQFKTFFNKSKEYLDKRITEDPHFNPADDDEYAQFIQRNRPKLTPNEAKKIERTMWINEAKKEVRRELEPKTEALRKEMERSKLQPVANQAKVQFRQMAQKVVIPEEYRDTFEKGGEEAIKQFAQESPLEYEILENATQHLLTYGDTLTDIFLRTQDFDGSNKIHKDLMEWVDQEQNDFVQSGQTEKDGKVFMRRERYFAMPENQRSQYYTWTDDNLLQIFAYRMQEQVSGALQQHRQVLERSGYVKAQPQQHAQPAQPAPAPQAPAPRPKAPTINTTPRPGNALNNGKQKEGNNAMLNVLGF